MGINLEAKKKVRARRLEIYNKASKMKEDGLSLAEIVERLKESGLHNGNGNLTETEVSKILNRRVLVGSMPKLIRGTKMHRRTRPAPTVPAKREAPPKTEVTSVIEVLMASNLNDQTKIRLIRSLVNES